MSYDDNEKSERIDAEQSAKTEQAKSDFDTGIISAEQKNERFLAAIGWLFPFVALILVFIKTTKSKPFLYNNSRQAVAYGAVFLASSIILSVLAAVLKLMVGFVPFFKIIIDGVSGMFSCIVILAVVLYSLIMAIRAFQGENVRFPYFGDIIEQYIN